MAYKPIRFISIIIIFVGTVIFIWNAYSFTLGYFASTKENDFKSEYYENPEQRLFNFRKNHPVHRIEHGDKLGTLFIPKLDRTYPIYEGTTDDVLKKGIGHYTRSAFPGEDNNTIFSGHRDTVLRDLKYVGVNDTLFVTTLEGHYLYKVKKVRIVHEDDPSIIVPKPKATLTITTCYPFYYVGDAPERYVVVADLIKTTTRLHQ
ncbi:class D sortase [Bacillus timonensis]|nr:class D sortase [Bacillus timonensis]